MLAKMGSRRSSFCHPDQRPNTFDQMLNRGAFSGTSIFDDLRWNYQNRHLPRSFLWPNRGDLGAKCLMFFARPYLFDRRSTGCDATLGAADWKRFRREEFGSAKFAQHANV